MTEYPQRRHAVAHLSIPDIAALIDVPDGARIHHLIPRHNPDGVDVVVESDDFDPVDWNAEAPRLLSLARYVWVDPETGFEWSRWSVETPDEVTP